MIVTLHDGQSIRCDILVRHEPRLPVTFPPPADTQPLPLAYGVVHQARMPPQERAAGGLYLPGLVRQVAVKKLPEWALADKTNSGAVFLGEIRQAVFPRNSAHLALVKVTNGKQCP